MDGLREYIKRATSKTICVFDCETDPFLGTRVPKPFTCGFSHPDFYIDFWGADCIQQFITWLRDWSEKSGEKCIIYCHNLGGFDYAFLSPHVDPGTEPLIMDTRIASVWIAGHEWRDSYRILPVALKMMQKDDFDYTKMETEVREQNRDEILLYQRHDCEYLREYIIGFFDYFGDRPTIANTAMNYLQSFHHFERYGKGLDEKVREYFSGGRCQAFMCGVHLGEWKIYDVNSMYPYVMKAYKHPISNQPLIGRSVQAKTAFVEWEGDNMGGVPQRHPLAGLDFTVKNGRFKSTVHEFNEALDNGAIKPHRIIRTIGFQEWADFSAFIDHFYNLRLKAKAEGDKMGDLFYKLIMNSAYGKFAQDPSRFKNWRVSVGDEGLPDPEELLSEDNPNGWFLGQRNDNVIYWYRPSPNKMRGFFNVGIGASITGAARATLLRGLSRARRAAYCDTDSIICEALACDLDEKRLGAWKLEAEGDLFACAGKKLYALFSRREQPGAERVTFQGEHFWLVKKAHKGAVLTGAEIIRIAQGEAINYSSDRPNFKLDGSVEFVSREIKRTG